MYLLQETEKREWDKTVRMTNKSFSELNLENTDKKARKATKQMPVSNFIDS